MRQCVRQKKILITGATGVAGKAVIKALFDEKLCHEIIVAVRNIERAKPTFAKYPALQYRIFDMEAPRTFDGALSGISTVFLLRPPQISNINKYFSPLIEAFKTNGIKEVVFLSVHGAEKSRIIPHNKIERLIRESGLQYTFLRPSYFMQNLTTGLLEDIKQNHRIFITAGNAVFNWVDVNDVGKVAAKVLTNPTPIKNQAIHLTGTENHSMKQVARILSSTLKRKIKFISPNFIWFYKHKTKQGMEKKKVLMMMLLHFFARFMKTPEPNKNIETITGSKPRTLIKFTN